MENIPHQKEPTAAELSSALPSSDTLSGLFRSPFSRRKFFGGLAAVSGSVLWSSMATGTANAAESAPSQGSGSINVGRGMADMTGETWGAGMNGYAVLEQSSVGLQRRQYARTFIFEDPKTQKRVVQCIADLGLMFQSIQLEVLRRLRAKFGDLYGEHNVLLHAQHTHIAPGGTSAHLMVDLTTSGFRPVTFEANVSGIVESIVRAHEDVQPSEITLAKANVTNASVNRSRSSWERNPQEDKDVFPDGIDPSSTTLHVIRGGKTVGFINWFAVHPTSYGHTYRHVGTDNKGYAAWATEEAMGVDHQHPENAPFVAAFANPSPGDISPNLGLTPDSGPGENMGDSARIIGERIMASIADAGDGNTVAGGGVDGVFRWVDVADIEIDGKWTPDGKPSKTSAAILGAAFAASSQEDGGGEPLLGFQEGARGGTPWVEELGRVIVPPAVHEIHAPKEVLLPLGYVEGMIQRVFPFYIHRIGGLVLISHSFEATITSGLRMRRAVAEALDVPLDNVIAQGYVNGYGHYVTTPEEYGAQNYEGGATAFGRNQLPAFQQIFDGMAQAFKEGKSVEVGKPAGDLTGLIPAAPGSNTWADIKPLGKNFGDILSAPKRVKSGQKVTIKLVGANPNNNLRHGEGYLSIEKPDGTVVANDSSESTLITFANSWGTTTVTLDWHTKNVEPGEYIIRFRGDSKALGGKLTPFEAKATVTVV